MIHTTNAIAYKFKMLGGDLES